tara:strand:+ start:550 stop:1044 length:495 start_codon:yes stop_codon:yes gene_type:complete
MPQLNPEFFVSQLFWLVLTFSFLLFFLWRISLPRISSVLEKRESKISNDLEEAKKLQAEAEKIQNKINEQIKLANEEASKLIKKSSLNLEDKANKELLKLDEDLEKKVNEAGKEIELNKSKALESLNDKIIHEITKVSLSKLVKINISDSEIAKSVDSSIKKNN